VNDALRAIGAEGLVRDAGFPEKWGAAFMLADEATSATPISRSPRRARSADVAGPSRTFDHLLLRHAAASGADVRECHRVEDVRL